MCVHALACALAGALVYLCKERHLSGQWSEEKTVCIINYFSETGMTNGESE